MNEARLEQKAPAPPAEEDAFFQGEAKAAMEDVFHLNEGKSGTEIVEDRVATLKQINCECLTMLLTISCTKSATKMVNVPVLRLARCACS